MNPYIHPENQKLLWNTIHTVPFIANLPEDFKNRWFKNTIQMFYEKTPHIREKGALLQINKDTVQYMMAAAKTLNQKPTPSGDGIATEFTRFETDTKQNTEWYNKAFADRQREYEVMHAKPLAPDINFAIKLDDTPLNNMDELIEKYKQDRERDMNLLSPNESPGVSPSSSSIPSSMSLQTSSSLQSSSSLPKKTVRIKEDDSTLLEKQIAELKEEIKELRMEMNELKSKMSMNHISVSMSETETEPSI